MGCATDENATDVDDLGESAQAIACDTAINTNRSLAVTDPETLAKFSFARVMQQIQTTAHDTGTLLALYQNWMGTFGNCANPEVDPSHYGLRCPRPETKLATFDPFGPMGPQYVPTAVMNRFDLAPTSGADCGEYRVVFSLANSPGDRGFIIFEAKMPNPAPAEGLAGCDGIASFWANLSKDASATSRATKLEKLFFTGITADGRRYEPVISAKHYGLAANGAATAKGQIRTNMFVSGIGQEWHLREFKLGKPCAANASCALSVRHVAVAANPANELFTPDHENSAAFQTAFLKQVPFLSRGKAAAVAMTTAATFNEFESSSQASTVVYADQASLAFKNAIRGAITNPNLTPENILDRATSQTCGGCHQISQQLSGARNLGDGMIWPSSLGFVHIDESSRLSPALTDVFLPRRKAVLTSFLAKQCAGQRIVDDGATLAGGAPGAPN